MTMSNVWPCWPPTKADRLLNPLNSDAVRLPGLVGLALVLVLMVVAAKPDAAVHLRFQGAPIPGTELRLELDGALDGGLSVRRQKVRARVEVDLPNP